MEQSVFSKLLLVLRLLMYLSLSQEVSNRLCTWLVTVTKAVATEMQDKLNQITEWQMLVSDFTLHEAGKGTQDEGRFLKL